MNSFQLYGTAGIQKGDEIQFSMNFLLNVFDKIEDQGDFSGQNIRNLLFKWIDKELQKIHLVFKHQELKLYDPEKLTDKQFSKLWNQALRQIYDLNKKQYKLMNFQSSNLLLTNDNHFFIFHFEKNQKKNFINEIATLKYIIISYFGSIKYKDQYDWRNIKGYNKMSEILNDQSIKKLSQNSNKINDFQKMKEFYQLQEKQEKIQFYQQIYTFPKSCSIGFEQRNRIESQLFQLDLIQIILAHILQLDNYKNKDLIQLFESLQSAIIQSLIQYLSPNNYFSLICLQLTLEYYCEQGKQVDTFKDPKDKTLTQKSLEKIERLLKQKSNIYQNQKYGYLQDLYQLINEIEQRNDPIYSIIYQNQCLPYKVDYQEARIGIQDYRQLLQELKIIYMKNSSIILQISLPNIMNSILLYGQSGEVDLEAQTVQFRIKYQPNIFNKIEDQGELRDLQNVRQIQFKHIDQYEMTLYFQYKELTKFDQTKCQSFQLLMLSTFRSIFNLNKRQYKLIKLDHTHLLSTLDGQIYFFHFEQNDNYDYTIEKQTIEFIIKFYFDNMISQSVSTNEDIETQMIGEFQGQNTYIGKMSQMLNHQLFQWLFKDKKNKLLYKEMLSFYKCKESQKTNAKEHFLYRFPTQYQIQFQQKKEIELLLFKIYILDVFQDKISKSLINLDNSRSFQMIQMLRTRIISRIYFILQNCPSYYSLNSLKQTISYYLQNNKDAQEMVKSKEIIPDLKNHESFIYLYLKELRELFNQTKNINYLTSLAYLNITKHLDEELIMCPILNQLQDNNIKLVSLPYEQVSYEEIFQLLLSKKESILRQFIKAGCYQKTQY